VHSTAPTVIPTEGPRTCAHICHSDRRPASGGPKRRNLPSQGSPANNASLAIRQDCQTSHAKLLNNVILEGFLLVFVLDLLDLIDYPKQSWS
jgi:hypothetical protein